MDLHCKSMATGPHLRLLLEFILFPFYLVFFTEVIVDCIYNYQDNQQHVQELTDRVTTEEVAMALT